MITFNAYHEHICIQTEDLESFMNGIKALGNSVGRLCICQVCSVE